ncbi:GNAT family N-acetyltransferase [Sulfuriflexus mobilis]|uniref:GNAT family N-acetyltransferase n=1 Tax=Sulfuriflexus mobilis TaxID=1811807 RepID=UPI000F847F43|nr:GNAT family N-acetyltransferase [Sulfuriflexus mobilis]
MTDWRLRIADWHDDGDQAAIRHLREQVFIHEQAVPVALEWDGRDDDCMHLLAMHPQHGALATARLCYEANTGHAHIGRMSVLKDWRRQGIGRAMLDMLIEHAGMQQILQLELNAQSHAVGFYQKAGFSPCGDEFLDAGIPHFKMRRSI